MSCPINDTPLLPALTGIPSGLLVTLSCCTNLGAFWDWLPLLGSWEAGSCGHQSLEKVSHCIWSLKSVTSKVRWGAGGKCGEELRVFSRSHLLRCFHPEAKLCWALESRASWCESDEMRTVWKEARFRQAQRVYLGGT